MKKKYEEAKVSIVVFSDVITESNTTGEAGQVGDGKEFNDPFAGQ